MEVEVLASENIAADSILMIRAGAMRRQAKISAGQPFQFPSLPVNSNPFKLELYQPLGSQSVTLSQHAQEYEIKLPADQPGSQDSVIKLQVIDRVPAGQEVAGVESSELEKKDVEDKVKKDEASKDARLYLQNHGLVGFVQNMLGAVLKAKPKDPFAFMAGVASGVEDPGAETDKATIAECPVEKFGEDEDVCRRPDAGERVAAAEIQAVPAAAEDVWIVEDQRALKLATGDFSILTTWINHGKGMTRFEAKGLEVTSTEADFEALCAKMRANLDSNAEAVDAAVNSLLDGKRQVQSASNPEECAPPQQATEQQAVEQATPDAKKEEPATDPAAVAIAAQERSVTNDESQPAPTLVQDAAPLADRDIAALPQAERDVNRLTTQKMEQLAQEADQPLMPEDVKRRSDAQESGVMNVECSVSPESELARQLAYMATGSSAEIALIKNTFMENLGDRPPSRSSEPAQTTPVKTPNSLAPAPQNAPRPPSAPPVMARAAQEGLAMRTAFSTPEKSEKQEAATVQLPCTLEKTLVEAVPAGEATLQAPFVQDEMSQALNQNKQLMAQNDLFRQEIERLTKMLDSSGKATTDELVKPPPTASTIAPADGGPSLMSTAAMGSTAKTTKRELTDDLDTALDFDECLQKTVESLYDSMRQKNQELRASHERLAAENKSLHVSRDSMQKTLARVCDNLEGLMSEIRDAMNRPLSAPLAADPPPTRSAPKAPPKSGDLEVENRRLEGANNSLFLANRKLRQETEILQSELSSRQVSRAVSRNGGQAVSRIPED